MTQEMPNAQERKLLSLIQSYFPLVSDPYEEIAREIGSSGEEAFAMLTDLRKRGFIRRIGPVFDSYKLGYTSTLCALSVPEEEVDKVADFINSFYNVTHNYLRENTYNIWFTVIAFGNAELQRIISSIEEVADCRVLQLPAIRLFKIKVDFNISDEERKPYKKAATVPSLVEPLVFYAEDKVLIRQAQEYEFGDRYPFKALAYTSSLVARTSITEEDVLSTLSSWKREGAIRRFGATLKHRKVGLASNVMVVWDVPEDVVEKAGEVMASHDEVSHCYERPRSAQWPHNLYTMIHGKDKESCEGVIDAIRKALLAQSITIDEPERFFTVRELKKSSMKYFCGD